MASTSKGSAGGRATGRAFKQSTHSSRLCGSARPSALSPERGVAAPEEEPSTSDAQQLGSVPSPTTAAVQGSMRTQIDSLIAPVKTDVDELEQMLRDAIGEDDPTLTAAADKIFGSGGKKLRPTMVFLVARATSQLAGLPDINERHKRIAMVSEMLHTASLVHDDVLDESPTRRGVNTVHTEFGTRTAILVGDYLFAQSSWHLANLENLEVIKLISQVIKDFASGEIWQAGTLFDTETQLEDYIEKIFRKTATLMAASCRSAAVFSNVDDEVKQAMYEYGRHIGLAFQVVDDVLDFTQSEEQLGKPQGQDLKQGNITAPALFALQDENVRAELAEHIDTEFHEEGSFERALNLVKSSSGLENARQLAREKGMRALECLRPLPENDLRRSLEGMVDYVLERIN